MKHLLGSLAITALAVFNFACAKEEDKPKDAVKAAVQEAKYAGILKSWTSEACVGSKIIPLSDTHYKIEYDLHGDTFVKRYNYYTDGECKTQVAQITYSGTLALTDSTNEDQYNSKHMDTTFTKVTVTAVNEEGEKFLELVDLCERKDFPTAQEIDMTEASARTFCILQTSTNVTYFDRVIEVEGGIRTATSFSEKPTNKDSNDRPNIEVDGSERFIQR